MGNERAQRDLNDLSAQGDSLYWANDYKKIVLSNSPKNLIPQSDIADFKDVTYSKYAPDKWFDETFILYGGTVHNLKDGLTQLFTPKLPPMLSGAKYSFILAEGIPFFMIEKADAPGDFGHSLLQYSNMTESKSNFLMLNNNVAVFYNADWQKDILMKALDTF